MDLKGLPVARLLIVCTVTFLVASGIMFFIGKQKIVHYYWLSKLVKMQKDNPLVPPPAAQKPQENGAGKPAEPQKQAVPAKPEERRDPEVRRVMQDDELNARLTTFLLRSYEDQKVRIKAQEERSIALEKKIEALEKKAGEQEAALGKALKQAAAAQEKTADNGTAKSGRKTAAADEAPAEIRKLANLYGQMKPDQLSSIVEEVNDETLAKVFAQMKPKNVAKIMALMDPQRAARLSQKMTETEQQ